MGVDVGAAVVTMADRAFLTRLRAGDGPSHRLLVLLDQHRVMTTGQLARVTDAPERTVRYRLERLREARLVDCVRPGRESGSAPRHWWLRPAGARMVAGTAAAEGKPAGMFVAHAAAITEVWLSLVEYGGSVGVTVESRLTDRAGWQGWDGTRPWSRRHRLTPDAVVRLALAGGESPAVLIEVDLASMTQTLLRQKVERYLAYAAARAWGGVFAQCPPLLLLTKTATRAATFVRTARSLLEQHERQYGGADPADEPVVAACGLVLEPARAVTEACWMLSDIAASEVTLREIWA
ncbi:helix-turn-helix domain-containing protein [Planosporangium thailandense]|uniref:Helix-turn-helix domain-containing protein n=1 Tax=Planosporangium thailandense TaxID=765197 RepID=A0ABX0XVG7_9ACTN|nr:replication-relaxation family protein [Planosporangium thailandense]NJC70033.1 helix-turn-helix domain-containing protein [Planosporangium thailandense]